MTIHLLIVKNFNQQSVWLGVNRKALQLSIALSECLIMGREGHFWGIPENGDLA